MPGQPRVGGANAWIRLSGTVPSTMTFADLGTLQRKPEVWSIWGNFIREARGDRKLGIGRGRCQFISIAAFCTEHPALYVYRNLGKENLGEIPGISGLESGVKQSFLAGGENTHLQKWMTPKFKIQPRRGKPELIGLEN